MISRTGHLTINNRVISNTTEVKKIWLYTCTTILSKLRGREKVSRINIKISTMKMLTDKQVKSCLIIFKKKYDRMAYSNFAKFIERELLEELGSKNNNYTCIIECPLQEEIYLGEFLQMRAIYYICKDPEEFSKNLVNNRDNFDISPIIIPDFDSEDEYFGKDFIPEYISWIFGTKYYFSSEEKRLDVINHIENLLK